MTTEQMVREWLVDHGFVGLLSRDGECSCTWPHLRAHCGFRDWSSCSQAVYDTGTTTLVEACDPCELPTVRIERSTRRGGAR